MVSRYWHLASILLAELPLDQDMDLLITQSIKETRRERAELEEKEQQCTMVGRMLERHRASVPGHYLFYG